MAQVVWTPVAVLFYIALVDRNPRTGERIYFEILDRVLEHAENAVPGHRHPDAPEGWFYLHHKRWLIFYRPHNDGIEVMRVVDAVRDIPRHLRDK